MLLHVTVDIMTSMGSKDELEARVICCFLSSLCPSGSRRVAIPCVDNFIIIILHF